MSVTPFRHRGGMDEAALEAMASAQHGVVTADQSRALGFDEKARRRRVAAGRWSRLSTEVYRLNAAPITPRQALAAAVLEVGPGALATRRAGAALWGLPGFGWERPEVLVKRGGAHQCSLGRLSESSILDDWHRTSRYGIAVVSLPRLCFELAASEHPARVARAVDNSINLGMKVTDLHRIVDDLAKRGRPGSKLMRKLAHERGEGYVPPASELERRFFTLCRRSGLPSPRRQVDVGDTTWTGRVDAYFDHARVIVELDGRRHWMAVLEAESDRQRDNELMAAGWRVLRVTWRMLHAQPELVVRTLRRSLDVAAA